ncbi:MAG: M48 family metalloprotease [Pseudoxanthomonas sp.]
MPTLLIGSALAVAAGLPSSSPAQEARLPDIGSSAGELLTPAKQAEYGSMMKRELRNYGYLLDDPLIDQWLDAVGQRLAGNSGEAKQSFDFFMLKDRQINAFATLGGYVAVNSGLVLTAEREDEVAAVLSHEIAHVTQQHVLRGVERAQRDQLPILLGMLAAIALAQSAGGNSSGDASMAALASGMGLMQQSQINYTRSNESEADRIGIRTLSRSGYDVDAMAGFFDRLQRTMRGNRGDERSQVPDYLQTHPVTATRISEAHDRAEQIKRGGMVVNSSTATPGGVSVQPFVRQPDYASPAPNIASPTVLNPLLPGSLRLATDPTAGKGETGQFDWARERLRVLSATTPAAAVREYESIRGNNPDGLNDAQQYGLALAHLQGNAPAQAATELAALLRRDPDNLWVELTLAQAEARNGHQADAERRFAALLQRHPNHRAIALTYAQALNERGDREAGLRAQALLRPLQARSGDDPIFQQNFARACELAGDSIRAGEAYAETAYLNGRLEQALVQLQNLKKRDDLDYYARARIDARIAAITPQVLELHRQGIKDPDLDKQ